MKTILSDPILLLAAAATATTLATVGLIAWARWTAHRGTVTEEEWRQIFEPYQSTGRVRYERPPADDEGGLPEDWRDWGSST